MQSQDIFQMEGGRSGNSKIPLLICSSCEQPQRFDWLQTFVEVLNDSDCDVLEERCKLYAAVDRADAQLLEMNVLKVSLARKLLEQCLLVHRGMLTDRQLFHLTISSITFISSVFKDPVILSFRIDVKYQFILPLNTVTTRQYSQYLVHLLEANYSIRPL